MKHRLSFVTAVWWLILCAIFGIFLVLLAEKQSHPSETENRMLAGFPEVSVSSIASGDFMTGFETFLSDGFFARDSAILASGRIMDAFSTLSSDDRISIEAADMERRLDLETVSTPEIDADDPDFVEAEPALDDGGNEMEETTDEDNALVAYSQGEPDEDLMSGNTASDETDEGEEETVVRAGSIPLSANYSYLWYDMPDGSYTINYKYENKKIKTYSQTLKIMQTYLPDDGVICFTQVPLSSMARRWTSQRRSYVGWGSSVEIVLEKYLEDTERIYVFSTYDILEPYMQTRNDLFYSTDHHWSAEGAYIVFSEMMKRQNLPVIPYDEYEYKSSHAGKHDVFNVLVPLLPGHSYIIDHVDHATEIDLMNYKSHNYLAFMNNTRLPWRRIVTGANTGRKALVICDSFGNAFTPYLLPYYNEVHMCDFRYDRYDKHKVGGTIGYMIKHYAIDDVYIITSTANGLRKDNSIISLRKFLEG